MKRLFLALSICLLLIPVAGGGFTPTFGLTIHLKPERNYVPREFTKPIPNPPIAKPQPMIQRGQGYVGEFEKQFLKEKTNDQ